jgi:membrane fusion protein (multidrug efflux system)
MHPTTVALTTELPGRISAFQTAEVRPQITGLIQRRLFAEGTYVRVGQPLYQIDSSIYRAAAAQAEANLASARANEAAAAAKADRYRPLAAEQAISQQDYADALAASRVARAAINQTSAALSAARTNLRFTTVPAPISGRIGRSLLTEGALATANQVGPLAVISVLDPVYVDLKQSAGDLLRLRKMLAAGDGAAPLSAEVRLKLDDGSDYGMAGRVEFSEVTSDPATGTVTLRARFANPQGLLLPGMFVRATFAQASQAGAFLVPQVALSRDANGMAQVYVVGPDNKAIRRAVATERTQGDAWVVTGGLKDGDRIITQGLGKVRPGQPVKPVPEGAPQGGGKPKGRSPGKTS